MSKEVPSVSSGLVQRKGAIEKPKDLTQKPAETAEQQNLQKPKTKSLTVKVDEDLYKRLRLHAVMSGQTHQDYIEGLIKRDLIKE